MTTMINEDFTQEAIKQAKKELAEEKFRRQVERYKAKLKAKRSFWDVLFPFKIVLIKKERVL